MVMLFKKHYEQIFEKIGKGKKDCLKVSFFARRDELESRK